MIDNQGPIGRKALADTLQIGEGSVRTILDKMSREGSIENTRMGTVITERGRNRYKNSGVQAAQVDLQDLTLGKYNCAVLVKGMGYKIKMGCEQRDEAVRSGAVGATTLIVKKSKMIFPGDEELPEQSQVAPLRNVFKLEDGDVVIIGTAFSYDAAEKGAVTAALALNNQSRRCWTEGTTLLSQDTEADDLKCLCLAIHELLNRTPVTMRSRNRHGVRCEEGEVVDTNFTGPMLEEALKKGQILRKTANTGPFRGMPVVVVPIMRKKETIAVIGTLDISKAPVYEMMSKRKDKS